MPAEKITLLPCPFCGDVAVSQYDEVESHNPRYIDKIERHGCIKCEIFSNSEVGWNRRADTKEENLQQSTNILTTPALKTGQRRLSGALAKTRARPYYRRCKMKTVYELSKELQAGLFDLHKDSGFDALCREITKRVANIKSEVLTAWFAEHGFGPGKAVLVEERTESGWKVYIRESTAEETERAIASANRQITPCPECAQPERVESMRRWRWKYCPDCGREIPVTA
jgi:predicted RNA-binding Zn-ribbon protein involved in translation (DUF1610 family)